MFRTFGKLQAVSTLYTMVVVRVCLEALCTLGGKAHGFDDMFGAERKKRWNASI